MIRARKNLFIIIARAFVKLREALTMSDNSAREADLVLCSERLAGSQVFSTLFREGMTLVEETAAYLDGAGRKDAKTLDRSASLTYATESMRLTTRLMQLASWLLLHRAVKEDEMTLAQANKEKAKVKLAGTEHNDEQNIKLLPERLRLLIERSKRLQKAVRRIDATMHATPSRADRVNAVERIDAIRAAGSCVHGGIDPAHRFLQPLGPLDQQAQAFRQKLDVLLVVVLGACELHLGFLLVGLGERHLALLDRAMEQKPGRELHEPRREAHALGRISEGGAAGKLFRFLSAWAVEIRCRLLDECHAVTEQVGEGL